MIVLSVVAIRVIRANPDHSAPGVLERVGGLAEPPAVIELGWPNRGFAPLGHYSYGAKETSAYISGWLSDDSTIFALLCEGRDELGIESRFRWIELISATGSGELVKTSTLHGVPGHAHCAVPEAARLHRAGPDASLAAHRDKLAQQLGSPERFTAEQLPEVYGRSSFAAHQGHAKSKRGWKSSWEMFRFLVMPWALRRNLTRTLGLLALIAAFAWMRTDPPALLMLVAGFGLGVLLGSFATRPVSAWVLPAGVGLIAARPDPYGLPLGAAWLAAVAMTQLRVRRSTTAPFPERQRDGGPSLAPA